MYKLENTFGDLEVYNSDKMVVSEEKVRGGVRISMQNWKLYPPILDGKGISNLKDLI